MASWTARRGGSGGSKPGRGRMEAQVPAKRKREDRSQSSTARNVGAKRLQEGSDEQSTFGADETVPDSDDEWQHRLKFVCQENPRDDKFKEAIQGLLKICFPARVLDEIGVNVIESQMLANGATSDQTKAMREVAKEEMVHRLTWLLAEQLDTPQKAQIAIQTIIARSHQVHGTELAPAMFDAVVSDFGHPPDNHAVVKGGTMIKPSMRSKSQEQTPQIDPMDIEFSNREEHSRSKTVQPNNPVERPDTEQKAIWDVGYTAKLTLAKILERIQKPRHLFSRHALPLVRRSMKKGATYQELINKIGILWKELSEEDVDDWNSQYRDLLSGDLRMLLLAKEENPPFDGTTEQKSERALTVQRGSHHPEKEQQSHTGDGKIRAMQHENHCSDTKQGHLRDDNIANELERRKYQSKREQEYYTETRHDTPMRDYTLQDDKASLSTHTDVKRQLKATTHLLKPKTSIKTTQVLDRGNDAEKMKLDQKLSIAGSTPVPDRTRRERGVVQNAQTHVADAPRKGESLFVGSDTTSEDSPV
ncbi:hypothetical protein BU16DRAFT_281915 [Lophium mytilinum]|uniref:Uncharacterized protein n=1 Tax=Lophium mytilinum TaxID=390894 RepID=A0A6A6R5R7_9PEZI|nr:hypothetical protein BU16DRAFT_281915 [Lophium mytilinum]